MSARFSCLWLVAVAVLSFVSRASLREGDGERCALDGLAIRALSRVDLFEGQERAASFCSIECALAWPAWELAGKTQRIVVREEENGVALDPAAATFVRSNLRAAGARGELRAFQDPIAADRHVRAHGGAIVKNPFSKDD